MIAVMVYVSNQKLWAYFQKYLTNLESAED